MAARGTSAGPSLAGTLSAHKNWIGLAVLAFIMMGIVILALTENRGYVTFIGAVAVFAMVYTVLVLSLNLQLGFTGLPNAGLIGFFGIGAYASAVLTLPKDQGGDFGYPIYVGILVGMAFSVVFGALVTLPAIRLREDYFSILAIAAADIIRIVVRNEAGIGGPTPQLGRFGLPRFIEPGPMFEWGLSVSEVDKLEGIMLVGGFVLAVYVIVQFIVHYTPLGHALKSVREDEDAAKALGRNTTWYKLIAFSIGAIIASLAGSVWVHTQKFITPELLLVQYTFLIWTMVLLGGIGNNRGVVIGAFVLSFIYYGVPVLKDPATGILDSNQLASLVHIIVGILIMTVVVFMPAGLFKERKLTTAMITDSTARAGAGPTEVRQEVSRRAGGTVAMILAALGFVVVLVALAVPWWTAESTGSVTDPSGLKKDVGDWERMGLWSVLTVDYDSTNLAKGGGSWDILGGVSHLREVHSTTMLLALVGLGAAGAVLAIAVLSRFTRMLAKRVFGIVAVVLALLLIAAPVYYAGAVGGARDADSSAAYIPDAHGWSGTKEYRNESHTGPNGTLNATLSWGPGTGWYMAVVGFMLVFAGAAVLAFQRAKEVAAWTSWLLRA